MCIDLSLPQRNSSSVGLNGNTLFHETYSLPQMLAVSYVEPGDVVQIRLSCKSGENSSMTISAGILDETVFRQAYDVLAASTLKLTTFESTYVEGTIDCNRDGLLYTSIPQNGNWYATVDGIPVETVKVGDAMLGIYLSEGQHTVTFTYQNDAYRAGVCMTIISTTIFVCLWLKYYKPFKKFRKKEQ